MLDMLYTLLTPSRPPAGPVCAGEVDSVAAAHSGLHAWLPEFAAGCMESPMEGPAQ